MLTNGRFFAVILLLLFPLGRLASATVGFKQAQNYSVGTAPAAVATGDLNGDRTTDLAVCNFGDPTAGDDGNVSLLIQRPSVQMEDGYETKHYLQSKVSEAR